MLSKNKNVLLLIDQIHKEKLLKNLIRQINKDASLVGIEFGILENSSAQNVVIGLQKLLADLISNNYTAYVNFLYRIDVSEEQLLELQDLEINSLSEKVTILILQKEWQKVCFKNRNQLPD